MRLSFPFDQAFQFPRFLDGFLESGVGRVESFQAFGEFLPLLRFVFVQGKLFAHDAFDALFLKAAFFEAFPLRFKRYAAEAFVVVVEEDSVDVEACPEEASGKEGDGKEDSGGGDGKRHVSISLKMAPSIFCP
jgi:hypothetical protein